MMRRKLQFLNCYFRMVWSLIVKTVQCHPTVFQAVLHAPKLLGWSPGCTIRRRVKCWWLSSLPLSCDVPVTVNWSSSLNSTVDGDKFGNHKCFTSASFHNTEKLSMLIYLKYLIIVPHIYSAEYCPTVSLNCCTVLHTSLWNCTLQLTSLISPNLFAEISQITHRGCCNIF
jgi:hypothetical protein